MLKIDYYSSADPNALSSHLKNSPLFELAFAITAEQELAPAGSTLTYPTGANH
jgi:hypothetical protein